MHMEHAVEKDGLDKMIVKMSENICPDARVFQ